METNLATSKKLSLYYLSVPGLSHAPSATASIAALLMILVYPVSGPVCHVRHSVEPDVSITG